MSDVHAVGDDTSLVVLERPARPALEWIEVEGECIVWSEEGQELHRLDPIATMIFDLCDGSRALSGVVEELAIRYSMAPQVIQDDVVECSRFLVDAGLLRPQTS